MAGRGDSGRGGQGGDGTRDPGSKPIALQVYTHYDKAFDHQAQGGDDHLKMLKISYADYSKRPARKQVEEPPTSNLQAPEGCNEFNIWYGRWLGEQWKENKELIAAQYRCSIRRDAGKTKTEERFGEAAYCCLFFARGCCFHGSECTFLHRIPTEDDEKRLGPLNDCFGRSRHGTDRDDMRGTGNFNRMNKTLYIGGLKMLRGAEATHKSLLRHFSEWGEVEQLRLIPSKAIAFVTYKLRACAEFALEAMHCQTLDLDELLNIRWAFDDPNPRAQEAAREKLERQLVEAMEKKGVDLTDVEYYHPDMYRIDQGPDNKRQRVDGGAVSAYPATDSQYAYLAAGPALPAPAPTDGSGARVLSREEMEEAEEAAAQAAAASRLAAILDGIEAPPPPAPAAEASSELAWEVTADAAGRTYYYNTVTSQTAWELPQQMAQIAEYARYYNVTLQQARNYMQQPATQSSAATPVQTSTSAGATATPPKPDSEVKKVHEGEANPGKGTEEAAKPEDDDFANLMAEAEEVPVEGEGGGSGSA